MGLYLSAPRCRALPPEAVFRPPAATSKFHTLLLYVRMCNVPEYSYKLLTGKFYCLWLKFVFDFLVAFCFFLYTLTAIISMPIIYFFFFVFISFGSLHVWKEPDYILFDSADGKYKLVLDFKTSWVSVMTKSPIKVSQGNKSSEWPSVAWTF